MVGDFGLGDLRASEESPSRVAPSGAQASASADIPPDPFSGIGKAGESRSRDPVPSRIRRGSPEMKLPNYHHALLVQHPRRDYLKTTHDAVSLIVPCLCLPFGTQWCGSGLWRGDVCWAIPARSSTGVKAGKSPLSLRMSVWTSVHRRRFAHAFVPRDPFNARFSRSA